MSVTDIIKTPLFRSDVPGIDLHVTTDIQPETEPDHIIAHSEYIGVYIITDGSNRQYTNIYNQTVALFFTHPHSELLCGRDDGVLYAGLPSDIPVDKLILVDQTFDVDIPGINLEVWSNDHELPLITLAIAPLGQQQQN